MTDNWPEVAIIILNWNHYEDTIECLKSLQQLIYSDYQIILVDNGSNDDSVSRIKEWASEHISRRAISVDFGKEEQVIQSLVIDRKAGEAQEDTELAFHSFPSSPNLISNRKLILIEARENLGFAAGCNVGIRLAISLNYKYVLLLNNDTVVNPDFLSVMVELPPKNWTGGEGALMPTLMAKEVWYNARHETSA